MCCASLHSFVLWAKQTSSMQKLIYLVGINESKWIFRVALRSEKTRKTDNPHKERYNKCQKTYFIN